MTESEAMNIVSRLSYKPGSKIIMHRVYNYDSFEIRLSMPVIDAEDKEQTKMTTQISMAVILHEELSRMNESDFLMRVHLAIKNLELHEVDEWFRMDGKFVKHPHPEILKNQTMDITPIKDIDYYDL